MAFLSLCQVEFHGQVERAIFSNRGLGKLGNGSEISSVRLIATWHGALSSPACLTE